MEKFISPDQRHALVKAMTGLQKRVRSRTERYRCFLDEQLTTRVPKRTGVAFAVRPADSDLWVNPTYRIQCLTGQIETHAPVLVPPDLFLPGYDIAWVQDSGSGVWAPYWLRDDWARVLGLLRPGMQAPEGIPESTRSALQAADILVSRDFELARALHWAAICKAAKAQFVSEGYAVVQNLIHPFHLAAARRFYRNLVAGGGLPLGDSLVRERYQLHSEDLARFFHLQLAGLVSRIVGEQVKASYVYFASYRQGASLPRHVDREQCEYSISFLVDYGPEPDGPSGWPLLLEHPSKPQWSFSADLAIGDALFYRGRELVHSRAVLAAGHHSTSLFFHFVRSDFVGRLW